VDAAQALADLTEISSQIQAAVLFDENGAVAGSTLGDEAAAHDLAGAARELLDAAQSTRGEGERRLTQLEAATAEGSVFLVAQGEKRIVATTSPAPTVGLVFYDLKSCLRAVDQEAKAPAKKPARRRRTEETGEA
jgi:predicted regulator of Ras-like GTPase activity (Roadblock/LC7/MglB family)